MQNVQPTALTDQELHHYAAHMRENGVDVPQNWVDEILRRYYERTYRSKQHSQD